MTRPQVKRRRVNETKSREERRRDALRVLDELNEDECALRGETENARKARKRDSENAKARVEDLRKLLANIPSPKLRYAYGEGGFFYESHQEQMLTSEEFQRQGGYDPDLQQGFVFKLLTEPVLGLGMKDKPHIQLPTPRASSGAHDMTTNDNPALQPEELNTLPSKSIGYNEGTIRMADFVLDPTFVDLDSLLSSIIEQKGKNGLRYWYNNMTDDTLKHIWRKMHIPEQEKVDANKVYSLRYSCLDAVAALGCMKNTHVKLIPHLTTDQMSGTQKVPNIGGGISADLVISQMEEENPRKCKYPLVSCEVKQVSVNYLAAAIKWIHYWKLEMEGGAEPKEHMPTTAQFRKGRSILRQNAVKCMLYNTDVVPIWDGQQLIVIIYDFESIVRIRRAKEPCQEEKDRISQSGEEPRTGRCRVVRCQVGVINFSDYKPSVPFVFAALMWRTMQKIADGKFGSQLKKATDLFAADDQKSFESIEEHGTDESEDEKDSDRSGSESDYGNQKVVSRGMPTHASTVVKRVPQLAYTSINDGSGYMNRVLRLTRSQYKRLFPALCEPTIILKVLDFLNLQEYHWDNIDDLGGVDYMSFRRWCRTLYKREVKTYRLIEQFNATSQRKIHAPKLLDYGSCRIHDDNERIIDGQYLVLEDLSRPRPTTAAWDNTVFRAKLEEQKELMSKAGFIHKDLARRNVMDVNGELYIIDFNHVDFI